MQSRESTFQAPTNPYLPEPELLMRAGITEVSPRAVPSLSAGRDYSQTALSERLSAHGDDPSQVTNP